MDYRNIKSLEHRTGCRFADTEEFSRLEHEELQCTIRLTEK